MSKKDPTAPKKLKAVKAGKHIVVVADGDELPKDAHLCRWIRMLGRQRAQPCSDVQGVVHRDA